MKGIVRNSVARILVLSMVLSTIPVPTMSAHVQEAQGEHATGGFGMIADSDITVAEEQNENYDFVELNELENACKEAF